MLSLIKYIVINNRGKFLAGLGAIAAWFLYVWNSYMRSQAEYRADNAEAELERLHQSIEAQNIIDESSITADKIILDAEKIADDILNKPGNDLVNDLDNLFHDK